jgi:hypothetical protein
MSLRCCCRRSIISAAAAARFQPDLVGTQQVAVRFSSRLIADLVQNVNEDLELNGQLAVDVREGIAAKCAAYFFGKRTVGGAAHVYVVIDVDRLVREAVGEKAADKERHVADSLQRVIPGRGRPRLRGVGHHQRQGTQAVALAVIFVQFLGTGKQREKIDYVVRGMRIHINALS